MHRVWRLQNWMCWLHFFEFQTLSDRHFKRYFCINTKIVINFLYGRRNVCSCVLVAKLAKDFVVFYGTQMFVIQFSLFCHLAFSPLKIHFTITLSYTGSHSEWYVVFRNSGKNFVYFSHVFHACHKTSNQSVMNKINICFVS